MFHLTLLHDAELPRCVDLVSQNPNPFFQHKTVAKEKAPLEDESFRVPDSAWIGASKGAREIRAISDCVRVACLREKCRVQQKTPTNPVGSHKEVVSGDPKLQSRVASRREELTRVACDGMPVSTPGEAKL